MDTAASRTPRPRPYDGTSSPAEERTPKLAAGTSSSKEPRVGADGDNPDSPVLASSPDSAGSIHVGGEQGDGDGADGQLVLDGQDPKRPRACESCRGLKVRCEPGPDGNDVPCKRCTRAGRNCIVTAPTRKRQKKTDSRVAELEKKIDALTASLQARTGIVPAAVAPAAPTRPVDDSPAARGLPYGNVAPRQWNQSAAANGPGSFSVDKPALPPPMVMAGLKRKYSDRRDVSSDESSRPAPPQPPTSLGTEYADVVDRGVISMERASELFARYNNHMVQHLPAVVFPAGMAVSELRKTKPLLFLAVMASASSETPNLQRVLVKELMQIFAEKIIVTGEKTLELVQALHIAVIWYWPPEHFEELKFYQLVHISAVMALDIGLGRGSSTRPRHLLVSWRDHPFRRNEPPDPKTLESRRTWLTCYFLASNTSIALRRPNLIRWTPFMAECMDLLEASPEAAPTDKYFCKLVWTHRLGEEVGVQFSMDDPSAVVNITDLRTQYALKGLERDLEKYRASISPELLQPTLDLSFNVVSLYMHEIAVQPDSGSDGIKLPETAEQLQQGMAVSETALTASHINALSACLTAIDGIFHTFLGMEVAAIRCLPVFNFVRVAYAVVVLIKMYFSANKKDSELGKVIDRDNMKVDYYLERLLQKFHAAAANDRSRPAGKFLVVLVMLRSWFVKHDKSASTVANEGSGEKAPISASGEAPRPQPPPETASCPTSMSTPQVSTPDFPSASTPLHLLSEVASADAPARQTTLPGANWMKAPTTFPPFMYDNPGPDEALAMQQPTMAAGGDADQNGAVPGLEPWMGGGFGMNMDFVSLENMGLPGLEVLAMGIGAGTDASPGSYENGVNYVIGPDGWMSDAADGIPGGGMLPF